MNTHFASVIAARSADREMFHGVPASVDLDQYVVLTDDSGSWILTTAESAAALDLDALPGAERTDFGDSAYEELWTTIAEHVEVLGDCNNLRGAIAALCAREGVEVVEQD